MEEEEGKKLDGSTLGSVCLPTSKKSTEVSPSQKRSVQGVEHSDVSSSSSVVSTTPAAATDVPASPAAAQSAVLAAPVAQKETQLLSGSLTVSVPKVQSRARIILRSGQVFYGQILSEVKKKDETVTIEVVAEVNEDGEAKVLGRPFHQKFKVNEILEIENFGKNKEYPFRVQIRRPAPSTISTSAPPPPPKETTVTSVESQKLLAPQEAAPAEKESVPIEGKPEEKIWIVDGYDSDSEELVDPKSLEGEHIVTGEEQLTVGAKEALTVANSCVSILESLNQPRCGHAPVAAVLTGAELRAYLDPEKLKELPDKDWSGLARTTMEEHIRVLRLFLSTLDPELSVVEGAIKAVKEVKALRHWMFLETLKNAASLQGALALLPLYYKGTQSIYLKGLEVWTKEMSHYGKKTKEEVPTQALPMTREDLDLCVQRFRKSHPHIAVALILGWLTAARLGCILQLEIKDIIFNENRLTVTFRRGKGVLRRGPYTVHTQPLPAMWSEVFTKFVKERRGTRMFPQSMQGSDLCKALRTINPKYEQRSIRRGALQTMASHGTDEETLMRFSGHTQVGTLRRYLNWNTINSKVQADMEKAAASLLPNTATAAAVAPVQPPVRQKSTPQKKAPKPRRQTSKVSAERPGTVPKRK